MKRIFILLFCTLASIIAFAQKDYKVVFDLTSKDTTAHQTILRWANAISKDPTSNVEIVLYGKSLDMVVKDRSVAAETVTSLVQKNNVVIKVCEAAMKHNNIVKSQLLPGVQTVPDGIYEIITKQREGWGYIKAAQ